MLTATEIKVAKNLGISGDDLPTHKGIGHHALPQSLRAPRLALHTRNGRRAVDEVWSQVAAMARRVGAQPTAFLNHVVDRALRELDETGGYDDGNGDDDRPAGRYDAEVARMLGVAKQELARAKAKRNGGVALQQRNVAHASTAGLLLNLSQRELARVARHPQGDGTFIPTTDSGADEVSARDFVASLTDIMADFSRWLRAADGGNANAGDLRSMLEQNHDRMDDILAKLADTTAYIKD